MTLSFPFRAAGLLALALLAACTQALDPEVERRGFGDFSLDRMVVIVDKPTVGALSRTVDDAVMKAAVARAMEGRLRRLQGTGRYSIGIKVQGYVLARPGIPILLTPRSALLLSVNVYDDVPRRLNPEPKNLTVFEDAGADFLVGSGYVQSREQQLDEMAANAAIEVERWLRENPQWFRPGAPTVDPTAGRDAADPGDAAGSPGVQPAAG